MAITVANLANVGSNSATSHETAELTFPANQLITIGVWNEVGSGTADLPTCTGTAKTWTQIDTQLTADNLTRMTLFRSLDSSEISETIVADCTNTQTYIRVVVHKWDGVLTTGTNGADAVVQDAGATNTGTQTGITVTLSAFADARNVAWGFVATSAAVDATVGSGFTQIAEDTGDPSYNSEWKKNDNTVDWTWSSAGVNCTAMAIEVAAAELKGGSFLFNFV